MRDDAPQIADACARLPDYLGGHVAGEPDRAGARACDQPAAGACLGAPARRCAACCSAFASVVQTIPGLALLALFYPLLLGLAALYGAAVRRGLSGARLLAVGAGARALFDAAGAAQHHRRASTASIPTSSEAALGVGMTQRQSLFMVELPLALPVIMAGIRTAAVWVIGTATLSTPIGQTSLGNYIFTGLQTQNWVFVLFGCVAAAVLALAVDQLLALIERGLGARNRGRIAAGALGLAAGRRARWRRACRGRGHLRDRHQDVRRAIRPGGADRAAAARRRPRRAAARGAGLQRDLRCAARRRDRRLCRLLRHHLGQPAQAHRREAARARLLAEISAARCANATASRCSAGSASRMPTRWRWHSRQARRRSACAASPTSRDHAPQLSIAGDYEFFARPEWQRDPRRPTVSRSASSGRCSPSSCTAR